MKKVILFMTESNVDAQLTQLGQLGVVHLQRFQPAVDESIDRVSARIIQMQQAITILGKYEVLAPEGVERDKILKFSRESVPRGEITVMGDVLQLEENRQDLEKALVDLKHDAEWYQRWGDVSVKTQKTLQGNGVFVRCYRVDEKTRNILSERPDVQFIGMDGQSFLAVLVTCDENEKLDFSEELQPSLSYKLAQERLNETQEKLSNVREKLITLSAQKLLLEDALNERFRRLNVRKVQYSGISIEQTFRYFQGFIPVDAVEELVSLAKDSSWGYIISNPTDEELENVPTLIRSPRWAERIKPVMNFMGLVPGYKELDVSAVFMIFFTFFTGILVGDAGYGLIFLLLIFLVHRKKKFKPGIEFGLMYTLSVSVVFWGVLTGTYFGSPEIAQISFLNKLSVDKLASFGGDDMFIQKVMFLIGATHLTIAHLQTAWKYINSVRAIAQIGWVAIVWVLYLVVSQLVLNQPAPTFTKELFIGGVVLIGLFSNPGTSFFKGIISSLGGLPLSVISGFSDVISYIRLYAVGLSTVLMAQSFNEMAIGDGVSTVVSFIGAALVLVAGHGLNMILAGMAVIVHGVRLNMLEYAGHASVEFSGTDYVPFTINQKTSNK